MAEDPPEPSRLLPGLILLALLAAILVGWWAFPHFAAYMARQDCIATGRTNCG